VPGCVGWDAFLELELIEACDLPDGLHGCIVLVFDTRNNRVYERVTVAAV
jgi:hypothetical protein